MRSILAVILIAAVAFAVGASGIVPRVLHDTHVIAAPTAVAGQPTGGAGQTATLAGQSAPAATATAATAADAGATSTKAVATPTSAPQASATLAATPSPTAAPPPAPVSLAQALPGGTALAAGGWTNGAGMVAQVMAPASATGLRAEIEVRPVGQSFDGTAMGSALVQHGVAAITLSKLASGRYHWQARLVAGDKKGPWAVYAHDATAFGVDLTAPAAPHVSSPTNPKPDVATGASTPTLVFRWDAPADSSGIAGYSYRLDTDPKGAAHEAVRTKAQEVSLAGLGTGAYYFHVRALDDAGNWGPNATYPVRVDLTPPQVTKLAFSGYYFDPSLEKLRLTYKVDKVSHVTIGIYDDNGTRVRHIVLPGFMPANVPLTVSWDGRDDKGNLVPPAAYSMYVRATDRLGNTPVSAPGWGGLNVTYKRIVVSLSQQRLYAYDGPTPFVSALVTTGNPALPTPTGLFHVIKAMSPFTFRSPWPVGSKYYYAPSPVKYALYFDSPGYFIHDAPWRSAFGPGTNQQLGTPGQNYTGTHGCVNVPSDVMAKLYAWATPGTAVQVIK